MALPGPSAAADEGSGTPGSRGGLEATADPSVAAATSG
jgi:hypothetical protein